MRSEKIVRFSSFKKTLRFAAGKAGVGVKGQKSLSKNVKKTYFTQYLVPTVYTQITLIKNQIEFCAFAIFSPPAPPNYFL